MAGTNTPLVRWQELDAIRCGAIATASGIVLEVGAGTGDNLEYFAEGITWIGLEPHAASRAALQRAARARGHRTAVLDARSERIPLADACVDCVVATFVMCSVDDIAVSLAEFHRVLQVDGSCSSTIWRRKKDRARVLCRTSSRRSRESSIRDAAITARSPPRSQRRGSQASWVTGIEWLCFPA
ncbi:class I SAM-dependent methyltransferase [Paramicrobacterium chengjingii]|uniref:Class I SAM-dependent methyltransferase n=1 Tax=Paramicrobacterium chengjingii TaxID=2769067 RepID=A0ABX6YMN5_9MICO|nr:class I SAM-dependent methyltransferase [Microbacterium chengjingii]